MTVCRWRRSVGLFPLALAALAGGCGHAHDIRQAPPPVPGIVHDTTGFTLSTSPAGLLRSGAEGEIQQRLVGSGLLKTTEVTGRLDDTTQAALLRFQASAGLAETGLPSYGTVEALGLDVERVFRAADPARVSGGRSP